MSPTQHKVPSDEEQEETVRPEAGVAEKKRRRGQWAFVRWKREDQLKAFFGWLPHELHDAPGINWTELSPEIMSYLVKTVGHSPDAAVMAVAAASMHGAIDKVSQYTLIKNLGTLLKNLRATTSIQCLVDLKQEQIWFDWAALQEKKGHTLASYVSIATGHFPRYLRRLTLAERQRMQRYALPAPPTDLAKKCFPAKQISAAQKKARKETTDILVPLCPILRQMVRLRKQLAERTLLTIREACRKVEAGEAILPYHFHHTDTIPEVSRDARTVAERSPSART